MKKLYTLILLLFLGFITQTVSAQLVANDDVVNVNGSGFAMVGPNFFSVRTNDTYNGSAISSGVVTITQISTTSPTVNLSGINVNVQSGTPVGTYTIVYQICLTSNPGICDTATVTVNVCFVATPVVVPLSCTAPTNSLTITGLPATGTWTLTQRKNGTTDTTVTGSGISYIATGLSTTGSYQYQVTNDSGCISAFSQTVYLGYLNGGLTGTMTGTYVDFNSNGIIDIGDKVTYQVSVTNTLPCDMSSVQVSQFGGTNLIVLGGGFPLAAGATNTTGVSASYVLTQDDINTGNVSHWIGLEGISNGYTSYTKVFTETDLSIPSGIKLVAFFDTNGNGTQDSGEAPFSDGIFSYENNNSGVTHNLYLYQTGEAIFYETNPSNTYDITFILWGSCAAEYSVPVTTLTNINVPDNSGITTYYFPITIVPCTDLGVNIYPYSGNPRPGFSYSQIISYHNYGNQVIPSGTVTFTHDPAVTMTPVVGATPITNGFSYDFDNMMPGETYYILVEFQVPSLPTVSMGQWLYNLVSITTPSGDNNLSNQVDEITQMITASYDPNDKVENHGGRILFSDFSADDYLTYTIRFENTGTANAEKVVLTDALDNKLDPTTVRFVDAIHPFLLDRVDNTLTVTFDAIDLPPSVPNTPIGKGLFIFQVKPKPGYAVGDIITNTANIYFDSNPAIVTTPVTTEFVAALGAPEFAQNNIRVYPNPAKSIVNISLADAGTIETIIISDISGKIVKTEKPHASETSITISSLANGLYFAKITTGDSEKVVKIIKE